MKLFADLMTLLTSLMLEILTGGLLILGFKLIQPLFQPKMKPSILKTSEEQLDSSMDNISVEIENQELQIKLTNQYGKILDKLIQMGRID